MYPLGTHLCGNECQWLLVGRSVIPFKKINSTDSHVNWNVIICVGNHYMQANTNNVNKTCVLLQTTGGKDEPNFVCMRKS
jgi:hypothetical protein